MPTVQVLPNNPQYDAAAAKLQAAQRGRSARREWADRQLQKAGHAPISVPTSISGDSKDSYPLYCMPVPIFLGMEDWMPHQDALEAGMLTAYDPATMSDKVLFISHQWTSWYHPDPKGEQLRALKYSLKELMEGKTAVRSNATLEMKYKWKINHTGAWWKEMLPKMFLWVDFLSMPQPLSARFKGMAKDEIEAAMAEEKRARHAGMTEAKAQGDKPAHSGMDHRQVEAKEEEVARLVGLLTKAVDCIPSYIQRSSMMWVLVPPIGHQDVEEAICDFTSWRSRGYAAAAAQSPSDSL